MLKLTQLSGFGGARRRTYFSLAMAAGAADIDLHAWLTAGGYRGETDIAVAIAPNVRIRSTTTAAPGLLVDLAAFPRHCRIGLVNRGEICGRGGASSAAGGTALEVRAGTGATLSVDNRGEINGGGGGGAAGSSDTCRSKAYSTKNYSCSGSIVWCAGGAGGTGYGPDAPTAGSSGQSRYCSGCGSCRGRSGRAGGGKGRPGSGSGGAAGAAIVGDANIVWIGKGVRNGPVS